MSMLARIPEDNPLARLDPRQRLAVELYTNPLYSSTFGKKKASAVAAGYTGDSYNAQMFDQPSVVEALAFLRELRREDSSKVATFLEEHAMSAAIALVQQLGIDQEMQVEAIPEGTWEKEPTPIMAQGKDGEYIAGYDDGHLQLARTIIQHNKSVASLAKEKREAIKLVLAYAMGSPDQHRKAQQGRGGKSMDLEDLDNAELDRLLSTVRALRTQRTGTEEPPALTAEDEGPVVEADFEVESDDEEE